MTKAKNIKKRPEVISSQYDEARELSRRYRFHNAAASRAFIEQWLGAAWRRWFELPEGDPVTVSMAMPDAAAQVVHFFARAVFGVGDRKNRPLMQTYAPVEYTRDEETLPRQTRAVPKGCIKIATGLTNDRLRSALAWLRGLRGTASERWRQHGFALFCGEGIALDMELSVQRSFALFLDDYEKCSKAALEQRVRAATTQRAQIDYCADRRAEITSQLTTSARNDTETEAVAS